MHVDENIHEVHHCVAVLYCLAYSMFGAGFENDMSIGQVAQESHLSWWCSNLSKFSQNNNMTRDVKHGLVCVKLYQYSVHIFSVNLPRWPSGIFVSCQMSLTPKIQTKTDTETYFLFANPQVIIVWHHGQFTQHCLYQNTSLVQFHLSQTCTVCGWFNTVLWSLVIISFLV